MKLLKFLAVFAFTFSLVFAEDYIVPYTDKAPVIDGKISADEWKQALVISGAGTPVDQRKSQMFLSWDENNVYIAVRSATPPRGKLTLGGGSVISDDCVEFWFDPPKALRSHEQYAFGQFQILVNPRGKTFTRHHNPGYGLSARGWKTAPQIANTIANDSWDIEMAFPAKEFGIKKFAESTWKILPVRNYRSNPEWQATFTPVASFADSSSYASFHFKKGIVVKNIYSDSYIPDVLEVEENGGPWTLDVTVNGKTEVRKGSSNKAVFLLKKHMPPAGASVKLVLKNAKGQTLFNRSFSYKKKNDRIWFTPESYIAIEHTFNKGADKADVMPEKSSIKFSGTVTTAPGRKDDDPAGCFKTGKDSLQFNNFKFPVPGTVSFWIRLDEEQKKPYRRIFATRFRSTGYFGLQDMGAYWTLFLHHFEKKRVDMTFHKLPLKQWTHIAVNFTPDKIEYFRNGVKMQERVLPFKLSSEKLGEFAVGGGGGGFLVDDLTIYSRSMTANEIKVIAQGEKSVDGDIAYYPTIDSLVADLTCNRTKIKSEILNVVVADKNNRPVFNGKIDLNKSWVTAQDGQNLTIIRQKLPLGKPLADGDYILTLTDPATNIILLQKNIKAKKYPWMNNDLARKERIIAPFTPLVVKDKQISCVLRDYIFDGSGLPRQITAAGKEILAAPIRFFSENKGVASDLKPGKFTVTRKSDTAVEFTGSASGGFDVKVKGRMEFDGMIRLDMDINKSGKNVPERFFIDIPVKKEYALLFHAVGEGIRSNPAGFLPKGNGVIWKSSVIPQHNIENFIPYIWVGDDFRGICYAADWEKDWVHGKKHDAVELVRHANGDVSIRLNLLNNPQMNRTRQISIALMASPVKPMPVGWRGWNDGVILKGTKVTCPLGSPPYWGSFTNWTSRYPTFKEFKYIQKLRETLDTGVIDTAYRNDWIKRVEAVRKNDYPGRVKNHTNAAFGMAQRLHKYRKNAVLYPYTCNAEVANQLEEYPAMIGEWGNGVKVSMDSYADYAIYYLREMLKAGFNGVYDDNTFFTANFHWAHGNAYIDENGTVHPSLGLWKNREYIKRQAYLMDDLGITPWITVHHTNANILPVLSMANNTMGLEWKYGMNDFQERFTPDYIRAVCAGTQGGFLPSVLDGVVGSDRARCKRATRTMLATLLPHEIRITWPRNSDHALYRKIYNTMYDFGMHEADCKFYAYHSADNPVKATDSRILCASYRRGNKIMVFCGSHIPQDTVAKLQLNAEIKSVRNLESGKVLNAEGKTISVPMPKHDFALLEIEVK